MTRNKKTSGVDERKAVHFTLSNPPSATSSRSSSPAPSSPLQANGFYGRNGSIYGNHDTKTRSTLPDDSTPGRQPKDVYETTLPWWRAAIRRKLVAGVHWESEVIAKMQDKIRTPWLDAYFVYTSSLGTHTFFMILLPAFFFFGHHEIGRGLLMVLALGVYCSSVVKDLICSPRPFAPPVTRLTIGSHHLEYGFPSTHSTNSVSIALFFFSHVHRLASTPAAPSEHSFSSFLNDTPIISTNATTLDSLLTSDTLLSDPVISPNLYIVLCTILLIYTFSIVFGRLYTAMHSFTDCIMGIILGTGIWWGQSSWTGVPVSFLSSNPLYYLFTFLGFGTPNGPGSQLVYLGKGLGAGEWIEGWLQSGGWEIPLILIPICLLAVHKHPQPVDDCPCFEDAIAFASVLLGALVSRWAMTYSQTGQGWVRTIVMPGSGWLLESGEWVQMDRGLSDIALWWAIAAVKMVIGVLTIFAWRLLAKSALHLILPPTFRLLARAFRLPHRRFYTPATEYKSVPSEFHTSGSGGGFGLHPIPSVIDLPSAGEVGVEVGGIGSGVEGHYANGSGIGNGIGHEMKMRSAPGSSQNSYSTLSNGRGHDHNNEKDANGVALSNGLGDKESTGKEGHVGVKHYDADVLTKVIVYAGIAVLATELLPLAFEVVGWGSKSWPVGVI
ncbi:PAP2 superfamily-domain-containing protein [Crassisporium funariophilum]|nr:PAP2 superfamily-domain-containing protein [Crassisporium funariophilum]